MLKNSVTMVTVTSAANSSLHHLQTLNPENKNSHLLEASFSSYLSSNEGTFINKLAESSRDVNPFISNREDDLHLGNKKEEDGEIGVFAAEKYFNGRVEDSPRVANMPARKNQHQKDKQIALETRKCKVPSGTASVRSESSWNSQSALLQSAMRNSSRNRKNKVQSFLAGLGCKCSCSDKNSVDISESAGEISFSKNATYDVVHEKTSTKNAFKAGLDPNHSVQINTPHKDVYFQKSENMVAGLNRENYMAFSTVNSVLGNQLVKMPLQQEEEEEEKARRSLEVFGSPILESRSKSLSFDKRLTIASWDATPKMEEIDIAANSGGNYNDVDSDASSDLFEIESLTGKSNPYLARQASDAASGCVTPTTCYAPSEASIEWSVVTASAAEYSVMSDCEEQRSVTTISSPLKTAFTSTNGKTKATVQRQRPSNLLGCKSHKAVRVAGDAFMRYEKASSNPQMRYKSNTLPQVTRFQAETELGNSDPRRGQHAYATQPMQRSHSPHASQLLYI